MSKGGVSRKKQNAERRGRWAEDYAAVWLQLKGYKILERRFKTKLGEIDLIAKRGNIIAIVEVKQRKNLEEAHDSLHPQALRRIERAAEQYVNGRPVLHDCDVRYDAVFILPRMRLKHLADAWRRY